MNVREVIESTPIFSILSAEHHDSLLTMAVMKEYQRGTILFNQGERADGLYIIGSGEIEIFCVGKNGKEQIINLLEPGELCAELPLFQGSSYPASARIYSDAEICYIDGGKFIDFACDNPQVLLEMLAAISMRTRRFISMIESLSLKDVTQRLAHYFILNKNQDDIIRLKRSKVEMAAELGTIPETLSRSIRKLIDIGAISQLENDKKAYHLDLVVLEDLCG